MVNSTTVVYETKREILSYANKLSHGFGRVETKFIADMIYGIIASCSILLSDIADSLKEPINKKNTIDRLSQHLSKGVITGLYSNYTKTVQSLIPDAPVVLVDDTDIVKPCGRKFEGLGIVRDGSDPKNTCKKGYICTEMVVLSKASKQPVSLFSHIHSSHEKDYKSTNSITYQGIRQCVKTLAKRAVFVFDRGYDANELFIFMDKMQQDYIIRLTSRRKVFRKGKWLSVPTLAAALKGKFKTTVLFQGVEKECYVSHINAQITASKNPVRIVLVYGLSDQPMMLATNKMINSKDDVVSILRTYLSRWRIEEYFRLKKQVFGFEKFRVRGLKAVNSTNRFLTYAIAFLALIHAKPDTNVIKSKVIENARALKVKALFHYYRIAKGIAFIIREAKTGIRGWFKPVNPNPKQLRFRLRL